MRKKLFIMKKFAVVLIIFNMVFLLGFNPVVFAQEATQSAISVSTPTIEPTPFDIDTVEPTIDPLVSLTPEPTQTPTLTPEITPAMIISPEPLPLEPTTIPEDSASLQPQPKVRPLYKKDYQANEKIELVLEYSDPSQMKLILTDYKGDQLPFWFDQQTSNNLTTLSIFPLRQFRPGKYTLTVVDSNSEVTVQEFTWGVLAINPNKSIYLPGEQAKIAIAVLNDQGKMQCEAKVNLDIIAPDGKKTNLTTEDGSIIVNPECGIFGFVEKPDFETNYHALVVGKHQLLLSAETDNGNYSVSDMFEVRESVPFEIERFGPTRIYPVFAYRMGFEIKLNEDFQGEIIETVPESFTTFSEAGLPYDNIQQIASNQGISSLSTINLGYPVAGEPVISQQFGEEETDPLMKSKYEKYGLIGHDGIDYEVPKGTSIFAVDDGKIILAEEWDYGLTVIIRHSWGQSYYGHLSEFKVEVGQQVGKGEEIGLSGDTGLSTGPHLHFGIRLNSNYSKNGYYGKIDPGPFLGKTAEISQSSVKQISWKISGKKGDKLSFAYGFNVPNISPEFYLLGPLIMKSASAVASTDKQSNNETIIFNELRMWQLAIDSTTFLSGTSWSVPSDWNSSDNYIEVIGGGGGGANGAASKGVGGGGGGGGAYSKSTDVALTGGSTVIIAVGAAGTAGGGTGGDTYVCNSNVSANCLNIGGADVVVGAKGGGGGTGSTLGSGGASASGVGSVTVDGGNGGAGATTLSANAGGGGGGGGGAGGCGAATCAKTSPGAAGNAAVSGSYTVGGNGGQGDGTYGGAYGAGGAADNPGSPGTGGTEWDGSHGSGGGGGGGGGGSGLNAIGQSGGAAGSYGAGGGGGGGGGNKAAGGVGVAGYIGLIAYDYTISAPSGPTLDQLMRHGKWFNGSGVRQPFTF